MSVDSAVPVTVANLTPTFWSVVVLTMVAIGALIKVWPSLDRQKRDGDASLREDLLERIKELEADIRDERRRCDEEMAKLRTHVEALQRIIVQLQISTGQMLKFPVETPAADAALERLAKKQGDEE
ncbi:hypothetical protein [Sphingomonas panaciterrae]|uniref:hypothetical protein n=1 Tax=Sphingomonas panaciterrae TaxID=1462999 RepID=UPI002FF1F4DC